MFYVVLTIVCIVGGVASILWVSNHWDELLVEYKMWSVLKFPRRIVFFVDKSLSSPRIEVWRGSRMLYKYKASDADAVYSGSKLGRIHQMYKAQLENNTLLFINGQLDFTQCVHLRLSL